MSNIGYIGLWRKIREHWLWKENRPKTRAEAWIDILLEARFDPNPDKVPIKDKILFCNYGESLKSLDTWAERWGWNKSKVRRFFKLLESDGQIVTVNETVTTRLTVCNYKDYDIKNQKCETVNETHLKRIRNASETHLTPEEEGKEGKKRKEVKYSEQFESFWSIYPSKTGKGGAYKVWVRDKLDQLCDDIVKSVESYKKSKRVVDGYIKNPETWLNKRCWEDEPDLFKPKNPSQPYAGQETRRCGVSIEEVMKYEK